MGAKAVLIKGGHLSREKMIDRLFTLSGVEVFEGEKLDSRATHGTGCTLSAAIAACIAKGAGLSAAIRIAKDFVTEGIRTSPMIGRGFPSLNHLLDGEKMFTERE
jgi:hydroxymethylpyrimidine kinase/phosphomethylpyrimidine kinase